VDAANVIAEWWAWSVPSTLQATVLLGLAWIADRLLVRRAWPQLLGLLWSLALARFFLPPDLGSPLSVTTGLGEPTLAAAKLSPSANALIASFSAWLTGAVVLVVLRCLRRRRLHARVQLLSPSLEWSRALERGSRLIGRRRLPRVGTLRGLATPAVLGLFRPTLLLPRAWLERVPTRQDEHAVLHELAHLKRGDLWLDELCAWLRAVLWFHPLAWIAVERLHALSELQCDQTVARALGREAHSYRDTLVLAARHLVDQPAPRGVRAFVGHPSAIIVRIERLERAATRSLGLVRGVSAGVAFVLAACVLPMAPRAADLREQARAVFAAERRGEMQSCFALQAAAMVLAEDSRPSPETDH
jgi:beta-lactamase regulating signal transducer with metallopeptidase domain